MCRMTPNNGRTSEFKIRGVKWFQWFQWLQKLLKWVTLNKNSLHRHRSISKRSSRRGQAKRVKSNERETKRNELGSGWHPAAIIHISNYTYRHTHNGLFSSQIDFILSSFLSFFLSFFIFFA